EVLDELGVLATDRGGGRFLPLRAPPSGGPCFARARGAAGGARRARRLRRSLSLRLLPGGGRLGRLCYLRGRFGIAPLLGLGCWRRGCFRLGGIGGALAAALPVLAVVAGDDLVEVADPVLWDDHCYFAHLAPFTPRQTGGGTSIL